MAFLLVNMKKLIILFFAVASRAKPVESIGPELYPITIPDMNAMQLKSDMAADEGSDKIILKNRLLEGLEDRLRLLNQLVDLYSQTNW